MITRDLVDKMIKATSINLSRAMIKRLRICWIHVGVNEKNGGSAVRHRSWELNPASSSRLCEVLPTRLCLNRQFIVFQQRYSLFQLPRNYRSLK
jgi:hypothetical protein